MYYFAFKKKKMKVIKFRKDKILDMGKDYQIITNWGRMIIESNLWEMTVSELYSSSDKLNSLMSSLDSHQGSLFDNAFKDGFLDALNRYPNECIALTALLLMYLHNEAVVFAQKNGGGGTLPEDWSQRPNENKEEWKKRCFLRANKMLK